MLLLQVDPNKVFGFELDVFAVLLEEIWVNMSKGSTQMGPVKHLEWRETRGLS